MMAAKRTNTASSRLPATVQECPVPIAETTCRKPRFVPGEDVEVRTRFSATYAQAKVVSASAGTHSYLVQYPAANSIPSRVERVAAYDVRAARSVPLPLPLDSAVNVARPASSKRPLPSEQSERGGADCCKKAKKTGKTIPMDALPLRRFSANRDKEEEGKKKAGGHGAGLPASKLLPAPVKASATRKVAAPEKGNNLRMMAAKRTNTEPPRLPATETQRRFVPGEDVEVRSGQSEVSGKRQMVIYSPAKVVSASAGTNSYLVQYPAANSVPSRTARVPASDVRARRRVLPPPRDSAPRPESSKLRTGKGIRDPKGRAAVILGGAREGGEGN